MLRRILSSFFLLGYLVSGCAPPSATRAPERLPTPDARKVPPTPDARKVPPTPDARKVPPSAARAPALRAAPSLTSPERIARARAGLPPSDAKTTFLDLGKDSPFVLALRVLPPRGRGAETLLGLVDVRHSPGILVGRHDFSIHATEFRGYLRLWTAAREEVILADITTSTKEAVVCGWWLHRRRSRFLCAPKLGRVSHYESHDGLLREEWETQFPPSEGGGPRLNGRILALSATGSWREVDGFRCLGMPVVEARAAADGQALRRWQKDSVQRHLRVARHLSQSLEDERATRILRDALAIDGCDAVVWRRLGRLAFQAGRFAEAVPSLATAAALNSRAPATLMDLGDGLFELDPDAPAAHESWQRTQRIVDASTPLQALRREAAGPREFARNLYEAYLRMTADNALLHAGPRRRARERLDGLSP